LAQIDSSSYGKTLLDTLQIQLNSGASVDAIVELGSRGKCGKPGDIEPDPQGFRRQAV
jgi:hypothetical protein